MNQSSDSEKERANCTVKAFSAAADVSYETAYKIANDAGRVSSRKFKSQTLIDEAKSKGFKIKKLRFTGKTLNKFIKANPVGRFYLRKKGHSFAVINGIISDNTSIRSIVLSAWNFGN